MPRYKVDVAVNYIVQVQVECTDGFEFGEAEEIVRNEFPDHDRVKAIPFLEAFQSEEM